MKEVPWGIFCTYADGRPKFSDDWLLNAANVVTHLGERNYCRLCDLLFVGRAEEHVAGHGESLKTWRANLQPRVGSPDPEKSDLAPNHAGRNGQDDRKTSARDAQYVFGPNDRRKRTVGRPRPSGKRRSTARQRPGEFVCSSSKRPA
jgi:hypothetical protein